MAFFGFILLPG